MNWAHSGGSEKGETKRLHILVPSSSLKGFKLLTSVPFPKAPCHSSHKYMYMHTKTQSHIPTHPCKHINANMWVSPEPHTPSPTYIHRCRHPRDGSFQMILTFCYQGLLTLLLAFKNQLFYHAYFHLLLDVVGVFCHHNWLFTWKLWQGREEALGKLSLCWVGAQGRYSLTWGWSYTPPFELKLWTSTFCSCCILLDGFTGFSLATL